METISCHSNQSSYPTGIKNKTFVEGNVLNQSRTNGPINAHLTIAQV